MDPSWILKSRTLGFWQISSRFILTRGGGGFGWGYYAHNITNPPPDFQTFFWPWYVWERTLQPLQLQWKCLPSFTTSAWVGLKKFVISGKCKWGFWRRFSHCRQWWELLNKVRILFFKYSLNPLRFSLRRETDTWMTRAKSWAICKTSILE